MPDVFFMRFAATSLHRFRGDAPAEIGRRERQTAFYAEHAQIDRVDWGAAAFEQTGEHRTIPVGHDAEMPDRLRGIPGLFDRWTDTLRLFEVAVQIRKPARSVDLRPGERQTVFREQYALLAVGMATVFVTGRNASLLQPGFQIAPRRTAGQTISDRIVYFILRFVGLPQPVAVYLLLACGVVKAVLGGQFLADFSVSDLDVPDRKSVV